MIGQKKMQLRRTKKSPEDFFEAAKETEKKENWSEACELFEEAAEKYKTLLNSSEDVGRFKIETAILYLRSKINSLLNLFKFEFEQSDEFNLKRAIEKIKFYQSERKEFVQQFPLILHRIHLIESSFLKKLEEWLSVNGLRNESNEIYFLSQKTETEILAYQCRLNLKERKISIFTKKLIKLMARYIFYRVYLGYGIRVSNLVISAVAIIVSFGFFYALTHCVEATNSKNTFNFFEGLYASTMIFISFDLDVMNPLNTLGKVLVSFEGILGFITFGGVIAYIWRKMK